MLPTLLKAANGHLMLCLGGLPESYWEALMHRLVSLHGFAREGRQIVGPGEGIYPDFRRSDCHIEAGYDTWSGNYLLSSSVVADDFLRRLLHELDADARRQDPVPSSTPASAGPAPSRSVPMLLCALAAVVAVAIGALLIVPKFQSMFVNFGAELPPSTRILLATYRGWILLVPITLGVWAVWPVPAASGVAAIVVGCGSAVLLTLFCLWACYMPIFALTAQTP